MAVARIVRVAGTIHELLKGFTINWNTRLRTATASSLMLRFPQAMAVLLGRSVSRSKPAKTFHRISLNGSACSSFRVQYFPIAKLQSGGCGNCRGALGGFGYPWGLRIWKRELISSKVVSAFTTFARDWLASIRSRTSTFLHGVKVMARGSGKGSRISYFLTNGSTTVSGPFMFKKNGIKGFFRLI